MRRIQVTKSGVRPVPVPIDLRSPSGRLLPF
jgi:hypothetical protein